jgi:hypothetical protein
MFESARLINTGGISSIDNSSALGGSSAIRTDIISSRLSTAAQRKNKTTKHEGKKNLTIHSRFYYTCFASVSYKNLIFL